MTDESTLTTRRLALRLTDSLGEQQFPRPVPRRLAKLGRFTCR